MFIWAIIFAIIAIIGVVLGITFGTRSRDEVISRGYGEETVHRSGTAKWFYAGAAFFAILAGLFTIFSTTFTVDTGSSTVLKDWTGVVAEDSVTTPGIHTKAPWQDNIDWNIKNQDKMFTGDGTTTHEGQEVTGAEISFTDKDGVSGNMDVQVIFSIKADNTVALTKSYTNQTDFEIKVVENDIKSLPRDVASTFTTVEVFEERSRLKTEITKALEKLWADKGVVVETVNIHGIRYPEDVQQRFKDAQNAQTDLLKAETEAKTAKARADGEAQAAISKATGEAEANRILAASLTPAVLQQRWIDAIAGAGTIIVPQDFTSLGNLAPQQ